MKHPPPPTSHLSLEEDMEFHLEMDDLDKIGIEDDEQDELKWKALINLVK